MSRTRVATQSMLGCLIVSGTLTACSAKNVAAAHGPTHPPAATTSKAVFITASPESPAATTSASPANTAGDDLIAPAVSAPVVSQPATPTVDITADDLECTDANTSGVRTCSFEVGYGNDSSGAVNVNALSTVVLDAEGRLYSATTYANDPDNLVINPGLKITLQWTVVMSGSAEPTHVSWSDENGKTATTTFTARPAPSAPGLPPSSGIPATQPAVLAPSNPPSKQRSTAPGGVSGSIG